jgi:hypothetical protein
VGRGRIHPGRRKMRGFYKEDVLREVSLEVERNAEGSGSGLLIEESRMLQNARDGLLRY